MPSTVKRQSAAVMFTDIAGYTSIMASDEEKALSLLQDKRKILKPLIKQHDGIYVKGTGDGSLSYFDSAYNASKCAKLFQESIYDNKNMNVRVGIHVGDIVLDDGDVYGDGVNVASRLESMSPIGGICVSNTVYDELRNKKDFDGVELGLQSLKGVGRLIEIYGLKGDLLTEPKPSEYQDNKVAVHSDDEVPSIAIIPFRNKGKEEDAFYVYGICADLISDCSSAGLIRVASLEDIEKVEHWDKLKADELATKIFVRYIAQGTLWKMEDIFQLSVELYDTKGKKVVWSDRWEEQWHNLANIKANLTDGLLKALDTKSNVETNVKSNNPEAYEHYLKGKYKFEKREQTDDIEIARGFINRAIELDDNLIYAKNMLAKIIYMQGDVKKSLDMYGKNIEQARVLNDDYSLAQSYKYKGGELWEESKYEEALDNFSDALTIFKKLDSRHDMINTLNNIGFVYTLLGMSQKAIETYTQTKKQAEEIQDKSTMEEALLCLGIEYSFAEEYDKALEICINQLSSSNAKNFTRYRAWVNICCGVCYFLKSDYKKANKYFTKGYDIYLKIGIDTDAIWTFSWIILSDLKMGKLDQQENLDIIHEKINQNKLKDVDFPEAHYNLFRIYNELKETNKSKLHLDIAYKRLIEIAATIKNEEYKHSFLKGRLHGYIVKAWKENN